MKLHLKIAIPLIVSCTLITFYLYGFSTNTWSFFIPSTDLRQPSSLPNEAVSNLKDILSIIEKNPNRCSKEITLRLSQTVRILTAGITDKSIAEDLTTTATTITKSTIDSDTSESIKTLPYACPDRFRHAKYGDPYFLSGSWVTEDCGHVKPISQILTVVFVTSEDETCSEAEMMSKVLKLHRDLPIVIGAPKQPKCSAYKPIVEIVNFPSKTKLGSKLNSLIKRVKTPLTLIARNLDDFNWLARLERQLSVLTLEPSAVIVGGSVRNKTGHWHAGCYQTELKQYILKYIDGYYKSRHECMYCDHLVGPFIARSRLLREHKFDKWLRDDVVFEDFFLGIKQSKSGSVLACPDVMYHSTDPGIQLKINKRETWFPLSAKLGLNRIVLPDGTTHRFSCEESKLNCRSLVSQVGARMMPVCCRDALINGYKVFHEFCVKNNVVYQIEAGSTLGAVKFSDVIPWDFDGDGKYYRDKRRLFSKKMNWTNSVGKVYVDHIKFKGDGFFYLSTPHAFVEFWAVRKLSADVSKLAEVFRKTPTLIRIGGVWVYAPPSPGLFARNLYGNEILRHSNSYRHLGRKHGYDPYNVSDPFIRCKTKHHACLDQFSKDGNIQFKIPDV